MEENEEKKLPFPYVAATVLFTLHFALNEAEKVETILKQDENDFLNKNFKFKKSWKTVVNGLKNRLQNLFLANKYSKNTQKDLNDLKKSCEIAQKETKEIMDKLTICCQNYLSYNDCVCESAITKIIIVGTLLNHATGIWEHTPVNSITESIVKKLNPEQEYRHFKEACVLANVLPDDVSYMDDINIKNCIIILADKLGECACKEFYESK